MGAAGSRESDASNASRHASSDPSRHASDYSRDYSRRARSHTSAERCVYGFTYAAD